MLKRRLLKSSKNIKKISILTFAVLSFALAAYAAVTSTGKPLDYESVPSATGGAYINTVGASQVNYPIEFAEDYFRGPNAEYLEGLPGFTADKRAGDNSQTAGDLQKFTTHEELITFIRSLPTTNMAVQIIGDYPKGLEWPVLIFSSPKVEKPTGDALRALGKPIVLIRGPIHGGETSAGESELLTAKRLAEGHADMAGVLDKISVVIVPRYNVDGHKVLQRGTTLCSGDQWIKGDKYFTVGGNLDMNRDNQWLDAPINRALAQVMNEYKPYAVVDNHEYGAGTANYRFAKKDANGNYVMSGDYIEAGFPYDANKAGQNYLGWKAVITTQYAVNLNIPQSVRDLSQSYQDVISKDLYETPKAEGGPFYHYFYSGGGSYSYVFTDNTRTLIKGKLISADVVDVHGNKPADFPAWNAMRDNSGSVPELNAFNVSQEGGFDPGIGRNTGGFGPAVCFLSESRTPGNRMEFAARVYAQYRVNLSVIKYTANNADTVKKIIDDARSAIVNAGKAENIEQSLKMVVKMDFDKADSKYAAYKDPKYLVQFPMLAVKDGKVVETTMPGILAKGRTGVATLERTRPFAYIMDGSYEKADEIAYRISLMGGFFERLTKDTELPVEAFTVTDAASVEAAGSPSKINATTMTKITKKFPAGSYVFYAAQDKYPLISQALEPEAQRAFFGKDVKDPSAITGKEQPFYRYVKAEAIADAEKRELPNFNFKAVMVSKITAIPESEITAAREATAAGAYGCKVYFEGYTTGDLKTYLQFDADKRSWFVYDNEAKKYISLAPEYDTTLNRYTATIPASCISNDGAGVSVFKAAVTPASEPEPSDSGSSGGCNAMGAFAMLLFVTMPVVLVVRKKYR